MRDPTHLESIDRWAQFVRSHPAKWKSIHTQFINAQFDKHQKFIERLKQTTDGREKIIKLYNIKNIKDCKFLL